MTKDALQLLSYLCENIAEDKYAVFDKADLEEAVGEGQAALMAELVSGGYAVKKYDDGQSVCCTVTVKGRTAEQELKALALKSDGASTVVRTDAAGRRIIVYDNEDKSFAKQIKKLAGSAKSALIFGLLGGVIGGMIGGALVALIVHYALVALIVLA